MARQVLFIQGAGEGAHAADAALAASLATALGPAYAVRYPPMPAEEDPDDAAWGARIAAELEGMGDSVILVGHSAGAVTLLMFLARSGFGMEKVAGIFLAGAPFFGKGGWHVDGFELPADLGPKLPAAPIHFYHGDSDEIVPVGHLDLYARAVPQAAIHPLKGRDHQLGGDMSEVAADISALAY